MESLLAQLIDAKCVEVDPCKCSGEPVLAGTRFPFSQVLAQIADGDNIAALAENFELDGNQIETALYVIANWFSGHRPRRTPEQLDALVELTRRT